MPSPKPIVPEVLHLPRLRGACRRACSFRACPRALLLSGAQPLPPAGGLICLRGEAIVDFASGGFAHLRAQEACVLPAGGAQVLALGGETLLLLTPETV